MNESARRDRLKPFTRKCPDCGRHSWFIGVHTPWYGVCIGCLRCGRQWADGEWMPLDFDGPGKDIHSGGWDAIVKHVETEKGNA